MLSDALPNVSANWRGPVSLFASFLQTASPPCPCRHCPERPTPLRSYPARSLPLALRPSHVRFNQPHPRCPCLRPPPPARPPLQSHPRPARLAPPQSHPGLSKCSAVQREASTVDRFGPLSAGTGSHRGEHCASGHSRRGTRERVGTQRSSDVHAPATSLRPCKTDSGFGTVVLRFAATAPCDLGSSLPVLGQSVVTEDESRNRVPTCRGSQYVTHPLSVWLKIVTRTQAFCEMMCLVRSLRIMLQFDRQYDMPSNSIGSSGERLSPGPRFISQLSPGPRFVPTRVPDSGRESMLGNVLQVSGEELRSSSLNCLSNVKAQWETVTFLLLFLTRTSPWAQDPVLTGSSSPPPRHGKVVFERLGPPDHSSLVRTLEISSAFES